MRSIHRNLSVTGWVLTASQLGVLLLLLIAVTASAQGPETYLAVKAADTLTGKSAEWIAFFVAALNSVVTIILIRVGVKMTERFLDTSIETAKAIEALISNLQNRPCIHELQRR